GPVAGRAPRSSALAGVGSASRRGPMAGAIEGSTEGRRRCSWGLGMMVGARWGLQGSLRRGVLPGPPGWEPSVRALRAAPVRPEALRVAREEPGAEEPGERAPRSSPGAPSPEALRA